MNFETTIIKLEDGDFGILFDDEELERAGIKEGDIVDISLRKIDRPKK